MTSEGKLMLGLIAAWQRLPRAEREFELAIVAIAAENHLRGVTDAYHTYQAVWDISTLAAPLPIPFVFRRGQA